MDSKEIRSPVKTSVLPSLFKTFGKDFFMASLLQFVFVAVSTLSPQIQKLMIGFVRQKYLMKDPHAYAWKGVLFAALLFTTAMFLNICVGQYNQQLYLLAIKIRSVVSNSIYKKSLKQPPRIVFFVWGCRR